MRQWMKLISLCLLGVISLTTIGINVWAFEDLETVDNTLSPEANVVELENGNFQLNFNEENLSFSILDTQNNVTYYSGRRAPDDGIVSETWSTFITEGLTIGYFADNRLVQRSYSSLDGGATFTYSNSSVHMFINLQDIAVSLEMILTIEQDGVVTIEIPSNKIIESNRELAVLTHLIPYPFFASSYDLVDGYIFLPDGVGARIDLSTPTIATRPYSERVYGDDIGIFGQNGVLRNASTNPIKKISLPVYGIGYQNEGGAFTIISKGAEYASINAAVKGINRLNYNYAYTQFNYREQYFKYVDKAGNGSMSLMNEPHMYDIELRMKLLGPGVEISNMARLYQNYLLNHQYLTKTITADEDSGLRLQFLLADNQPNIFGNQEKVVTTLTKITKYVEELQNQDVPPIQVSVLGYQGGGYSNTDYGSFSFAGKNAVTGYRDLLLILKQKGLTFAFDYGLIHTSSRGYNENNIAKTISNQGVYDFDHLTYSNNPDLKKRVLMNYPKIEEKYGLDSRELQKYISSDVQIDINDLGHVLYSSHYGYQASRSAVISDYQNLLSKSNVKINLTTPFAYLLPYLNQALDFETDSSGFYIAMEEVPFYPMILSGFVPMYSKPLNLHYSRRDILELIDYNIYPSFLLTETDAVELFNTNSRYLFSSMMDTWLPNVVTTSKFIVQALINVRGARIVNRVQLAANVYMTTYDNDVSIIINYGKAEYINGEVQVAPEGYVVR